MAVIVSAGFGVIQIFAAPHLWWTGVINIVGAAIYAMVPWLHRFGELVAPLTFIGTAYVSIFVICWFVGTGSGLQFYFLVASASWCCNWASTGSSWQRAWRPSPPGW
jgi:adenylate cyclase